MATETKHQDEVYNNSRKVTETGTRNEQATKRSAKDEAEYETQSGAESRSGKTKAENVAGAPAHQSQYDDMTDEEKLRADEEAQRLADLQRAKENLGDQGKQYNVESDLKKAQKEEDKAKV